MRRLNCTEHAELGNNLILNYFKKDLITTGNIRILFMISDRKFKELEAVVKFYIIIVYFIVLYE